MAGWAISSAANSWACSELSVDASRGGQRGQHRLWLVAPTAQFDGASDVLQCVLRLPARQPDCRAEGAHLGLLDARRAFRVDYRWAPARLTAAKIRAVE